MMVALRMSEEAFSYLAVQSGHVSAALAHGRDMWATAMVRALEEDYESIKPFVPAHISAVLDIGSGLGAIDLLIYKRHGHPGITLLDGMRDRPDIVRQDQTFSSASVARRFLLHNGVNPDHLHFIDPNRAQPKQGVVYDLILSTRSWCYHYEPAKYLDLVLGSIRRGSWIMVDVRRQQVRWKQQLIDVLGNPFTVRVTDKYERIAFRVN